MTGLGSLRRPRLPGPYAPSHWRPGHVWHRVSVPGIAQVCRMIDFYYWGTPNGQKVRVFLEESGLEHRVHRVDIGKGEQFDPKFLAISPNNRIPAIVDQAPV